MITPDAFLTVLAKLPPLMQRLTKHSGLVDHAMQLEDTYRLNGKQSRAMMALETSVIALEIPPTAVLDYVNKEMGLDSATAKKFTNDFLGLICLPMQWYIGNVEQVIKQLSGDLGKYQAQVAKTFADLNEPEAGAVYDSAAAEAPTTTEPSTEPAILRDLDERLSTMHGRAEILLRMTALSQQVEEAAKAQRLTPAVSEELLHGLDALSYAVNTKDLNPLEVAAIRRRLKNLLGKFEAASHA